MNVPITVFYSYAQNSQDEALRQKLEAHLISFEHSGRITGWNRHAIIPGHEWAQVVDQHLNNAQIILLLISADFMASSYSYGVEMTRAMELHRQGKARVIPIMLRPVFFENAPFAKLEMLPSNGKPVTSWSHPDEAFTDIAQGLNRILQEMSAPGAIRPAPTMAATSATSARETREIHFHAPVQGQTIGDANTVTNIFHAVSQPQEQKAAAQQTLAGDVLLVTATRIEVEAVLSVYKETMQRDFTRRFKKNKTYYDLGSIGDAHVFLTQSEMGTSGPGGSLMTVSEGMQAITPSTMIMVGIAFGMPSKKVHMGDILVSRQLMPYEQQRVGTDSTGGTLIVQRGDRAHASVRLVDRVSSALIDWQGPEVHTGLILSGEKLVDKLALRAELQRIEPEALGGEMEGAGLYTVAQHNHVDWILIKAICDWGDGKKAVSKTQRQQQAALNAARFTFHVMGQGGLAVQPE